MMMLVNKPSPTKILYIGEKGPVSIKRGVACRKICRLKIRLRSTCFQLSRNLAIHGEAKEEKEINDNQAVYVLHSSPYSYKWDQDKNSECDTNSTGFPLLLLRNLFNIFDYSFGHHTSYSLILTFFNRKRLVRQMQWKDSCEYVLQLQPVLKAFIRS